MTTYYSLATQVAGGLFGLGAAVEWFRAKLPLPPFTFGSPMVHPNYSDLIDSRFKAAWVAAIKANSRAAFLTGIAVLLQSVGSLLSALNH
jgi:hypothetical protein